MPILVVTLTVPATAMVTNAKVREHLPADPPSRWPTIDRPP